MVAATLTGAEFNGDSLDDAAEELFRRMTKPDAEQPSDNEGDVNEDESTDEEESEEESEETLDDSEEDEESEEAEEEEEEESEEEDEEEQKDTKKDKQKRVVVEPDADVVVKAKIDGQEREIPLKDLTRLYGQEASLTRKSQEAAELKKTAETQGAKYVAGMEALLKRAQDRWEPYSKINFLALTKNPDVSPEELSALHAEATKAYEDLQYLQTSLDHVVKDVEQVRQANLMNAAREAVKVLSDPKTGIPGWGDKLYNDIRQFAVSNGMDARVVNELVDPNAIKLLHMAMQFAKGTEAAKTVTKKVNKTPKRILKGEPEEVTKRIKSKPQDSAMKRLSKTGSVEDAADLILARMGIES